MGLSFGERIDSAASKVETALKISLSRGTSNGRVVYASDYAVPAAGKAFYSIELVADERGLLDEVVQRTDF